MEPTVSLKGSESKLHPAIQDLVRLIFDVENMKKAMMEYEVRLYNSYIVIDLYILYLIRLI